MEPDYEVHGLPYMESPWDHDQYGTIIVMARPGLKDAVAVPMSMVPGGVREAIVRRRKMKDLVRGLGP